MDDFTERRLLAVFAHPDDETFLCGGTLARYASEGGRVSLICGTRGEVGEISDPNLAGHGNLGRYVRRSYGPPAGCWGFKMSLSWGTVTRGWTGRRTTTTLMPSAAPTWARSVGTWSKWYAGSGPRCSLPSTPTAATATRTTSPPTRPRSRPFPRLPTPSRYPEHLIRGLRPHRPDRLYYAVFPRSAARAIQATMREIGAHSDFLEIDPESMGVPDEEITTVLDVGGYADRKEDAARCHKTQV